MDLSIVIPTYNEKENILILVEKIFNELKQNNIAGEIIVVDDNSPDGTGKILENLKNKSINIIHRSGKLGLSSAAIEGFKQASSDVVCLMDADLSHPAEKISEMFTEIKNGYDLIIGSRYIKTGKIVGWNFKRKLMSKTATYLARPFTKVKDPMTGFFMIKKECLNLNELDSKGFKILLEILVKSKIEKIKEIPITFTNRKEGKSKASSKEISDYLKNLYGYSRLKKPSHVQFVKFAIVGAIGTIINLFVLYILTELFGLYYLISAIFAFFLAMTNNYVFNKKWAFNEKIETNFTSKYLKFALVSVFGLVINLSILYYFVEYLGLYYMLAQVFGIVSGFLLNFFLNKHWTFKNKVL